MDNSGAQKEFFLSACSSFSWGSSVRSCTGLLQQPRNENPPVTGHGTALALTPKWNFVAQTGTACPGILQHSASTALVKDGEIYTAKLKQKIIFCKLGSAWINKSCLSQLSGIPFRLNFSFAFSFPPAVELNLGTASLKGSLVWWSGKSDSSSRGHSQPRNIYTSQGNSEKHHQVFRYWITGNYFESLIFFFCILFYEDVRTKIWNMLFPLGSYYL